MLRLRLYMNAVEALSCSLCFLLMSSRSWIRLPVLASLVSFFQRKPFSLKIRLKLGFETNFPSESYIWWRWILIAAQCIVFQMKSRPKFTIKSMSELFTAETCQIETLVVLLPCSSKPTYESWLKTIRPRIALMFNAWLAFSESTSAMKCVS